VTPLEILDAAVGEGTANPVTPDPGRLCGKTMARWGSSVRCWRYGRWEFPGSGFTGRMCTQHGAQFIRPRRQP
jgi:hypothetical protein